jgi:hypothetical protein
VLRRRATRRSPRRPRSPCADTWCCGSM